MRWRGMLIQAAVVVRQWEFPLFAEKRRRVIGGQD